MSSPYSPPAPVLAAGQLTVGAQIASIARAFPLRIAIGTRDETLTFRELDARTNRIARLLADRGIGRQDRVAILANNHLDYMQVIVACAKIGAIAACQNWRLGARELQHCIDLVEPKMLFFADQTRAALETVGLRGIPTLAFGAPLADAIDGIEEAPLASEVGAEDGLVIIYTSGTTGLPKGALISHRAMIARAMLLKSDLALPNEDSFMAWAPMFHMISTDQSLGMLMRGNRVHVVDGYDVDEMARIIETYPMGLLPLVPGMVGAFVSELERRGTRPKKMNYVGAMADLVPRAEIEQATSFFDAPYFNTFGATETGIGPGSGAGIPPGPVPDRMPKTQNSMYDVRLVDENDNEVADGEPGEVSIVGPALFSGYWNNPEANARDFRGGRFHMGDVLRRNADGLFEYVDRAKYMIKSGGENIYPAEIETVLQMDERVETAVVVKRPDPRWAEVPVAFVVTRDGTVTSEELQALCAANLSRYKHPKDYLFIEDADLPRSTTGKIQRHILEQRLQRQA